MDTSATVAQSIRMIQAGCELVRITAPSKKEAENLANIKNELNAKGFTTPLVADIHFTPNAAEIAAGIVEKVRVNPGNYADKKKFEELEYTDETYQAELERIKERFTPLVLLCKKHGTAMRIGTNHGSLSDRILSRYGDTPQGMVESAMEFLRICRENDFHEIVISMKASNPQVMVQAYRLLVHEMMNQGMNYPLHLGVTEAGDGEDGRIKSAIGIGTLLEDGIGDTIRVSLTEEPEAEIPVAKILADRYIHRVSEALPIPPIPYTYNAYEYQRRDSIEVQNIGHKQVPRVIMDFSGKSEITPASLFAVGYNYSVPLDKWNLTDMACDFVYAGNTKVSFEIPGTLGIIYDYETWKSEFSRERVYPYFKLDNYQPNERSFGLHFLELDAAQAMQSNLLPLKEREDLVIVLKTKNPHSVAEMRAFFFLLGNLQLNIPVIIKKDYHGLSEDEFMLYSSTDIGALFLDGFGDGLMLHCDGMPLQKINSTAFGILQATRTRISKTEYISCPSCGRTLFDLQETTAKIRLRTSHLKGIKIGIMGCIVNGPGEMADADYGYVGTGPGKITLYKEKNVVKKNVPEEDAVQELINLIREHGDWVDAEN